MNFPDNLQYLRREKGMTQEQLAETLAVSRQAVSKWEAGQSYPEMDKIVMLCDLFDVDMETLIQKDIPTLRVTQSADEHLCDGKTYDIHMKKFARMIAFGVGTILFGVTVLLVVAGTATPESEETVGLLATILLLVFVAIGVFALIIAGIQHDGFTKENPRVENPYSQQHITQFNNRFAIAIAGGVVLILLGVVGVLSAPLISPDASSYAPAILLATVTIAVPIFIVFSMRKSALDVDEYNHGNLKDPELVAERDMVGSISGVIMLSATAIFLLLGFVWNMWATAWVVFPIGGILCGIVATAMQTKKR